jgi:hypothetical protein
MVTIAGVTQGAPTGNFGVTEITTPVLASTAKLSQPLGVAVDARGNVYFADSLQDAIQEVSCGNLYPYAQLTTRTTAVTVDKFGNIFYGDANGNIYKNLGELFPVNTLGTGTTGYYVVPQLLTTIAQSVIAMTTDSTGNLFVLSDNQGGNRPAQYTITKIGPENVNPSVTTVSNTFITEATFENLHLRLRPDRKNAQPDSPDHASRSRHTVWRSYVLRRPDVRRGNGPPAEFRC